MMSLFMWLSFEAVAALQWQIGVSHVNTEARNAACGDFSAAKIQSFCPKQQYFRDAMWGPPVIRWFINPISYSYRYHKP